MFKISVFSVVFTAIAIQVGFAQQVEIRLKAQSMMTTRKIIRVLDVADIKGGDPAVRQKLSALDLDEFSNSEAPIEISSEQIFLRAAVARVDSDKFTIEPGITSVHYFDSMKVNQIIEQAIIDQILDTYQLSREQIDFKLVSPLVGQIEKAGLDLMTMVVNAKLPTEIPLGQRTIPILISDTAGNSIELRPVCKSTLFREVVMIKSNVARGEVIDESKVERVRRPVSSNSVAFASYEQVIGKIAQSDLQQYALVSSASLQNPMQAKNQVVIKRNSTVNVHVRQGGLTVTLKNVRANQNGSVGEMIEFHNPISRKSIFAKVVDANTAIIEN